MYREEHNIFREGYRRFLENEIVPHIAKWEEVGVVDKEAWLKMGAQGFLCSWLPEEYGGSSADFIYSVVVNEELVKAGGISLLAPMHSDIIAPYIFELGTEEQKKKWLPRCASGETILSLCATEPNAGSDVAGFKTRADREGGHYVLNGSKTFISNGLLSDLTIVVARTNWDGPRHKGLSLFLVETDTPGFKRGRKLDKMGMKGQDTCEIFLEDCRIPAENLLGEENKGFYYFMHHLQQERIVATIFGQALAEAALETTLEYTRDRKIGGTPVQSFQANAFRLVEMATEVQLGRAFLERLIQAHIRGENVVNEVSMAKAWIPEMANRVAYGCLQLHGGYGYMEEYPICRIYRDVRINSIYAGTTEVMKHIVARNMGLY